MGCTGQDGSFLSRSLLQQGFNVIGTSRAYVPNISNLKKLNIDKDIQIKTIDHLDQEIIKNLITQYYPLEIYNLSAQSSVGLSFKYPEETFKSIVLATSALLESCRSIDYQGRIFFAGSSEIYGETITKAEINSPFSPKSPYAIAKIASMHTVSLYRKVFNLQCVTGVLFNHESQLRKRNFVIRKIVEGALKSSQDKTHKIKLGNLNIFRDWGWAEEYIEAIQLITRSKRLTDQIICTGKLTSLEEIVHFTYNYLNLNWNNYIEIDKNLYRENEIKISVGNPSKLKNDTGWEAKIKGENIIKNLIYYFQT